MEAEEFFASMNLLEKTVTCAICMDLMSNPTASKCGHPFCGACITNIFSRPKGNQKCPLCMTPVSRRNFKKRSHVQTVLDSFVELIEAMRKDKVDVDFSPFDAAVLSNDESRQTKERKGKIEVFEDSVKPGKKKPVKSHENVGFPKNGNKTKHEKRDYSRNKLSHLDDSQFLSVSQRGEQIFEFDVIRQPTKINLGESPKVKEKVSEWLDRFDGKDASPPSIVGEMDENPVSKTPQEKKFFKNERNRVYKVETLATPLRARTKSVPTRRPKYMNPPREKKSATDPYSFIPSQSEPKKTNKKGKATRSRAKKKVEKSPSPDLMDDFDRLFGEDLNKNAPAKKVPSIDESTPEVPASKSPEIVLFESQPVKVTPDINDVKKIETKEVKKNVGNRIKDVTPAVQKRVTRAKAKEKAEDIVDDDLNLSVLFASEETVVIEDDSIPTTSSTGVIPPDTEPTSASKKSDLSRKSINGRLVKNLGKFKPPPPVPMEKAESLVSVLKGHGSEKDGAKKKVMFQQPTEIALYDVQSSNDSSEQSQRAVPAIPPPDAVVLQKESPAKVPVSPGWSRVAGLKGEFEKKGRASLDITTRSTSKPELAKEIEYICSSFDEAEPAAAPPFNPPRLPPLFLPPRRESPNAKLVPVVPVSPRTEQQVVTIEDSMPTLARRATFSMQAETQDLASLASKESTQDLFSENVQRQAQSVTPVQAKVKKIRIIPKESPIIPSFQERLDNVSTAATEVLTSEAGTITTNNITFPAARLSRGGQMLTSFGSSGANVPEKESRNVEIQVTQSLFQDADMPEERAISRSHRTAIPFFKAGAIRTPPKTRHVRFSIPFMALGKLGPKLSPRSSPLPELWKAPTSDDHVVNTEAAKPSADHRQYKMIERTEEEAPKSDNFADWAEQIFDEQPQIQPIRVTEMPAEDVTILDDLVQEANQSVEKVIEDLLDESRYVEETSAETVVEKEPATAKAHEEAGQTVEEALDKLFGESHSDTVGPAEPRKDESVAEEKVAEKPLGEATSGEPATAKAHVEAGRTVEEALEKLFCKSHSETVGPAEPRKDESVAEEKVAEKPLGETTSRLVTPRKQLQEGADAVTPKKLPFRVWQSPRTKDSPSATPSPDLRTSTPTVEFVGKASEKSFVRPAAAEVAKVATLEVTADSKQKPKVSKTMSARSLKLSRTSTSNHDTSNVHIESDESQSLDLESQSGSSPSVIRLVEKDSAVVTRNPLGEKADRSGGEHKSAHSADDETVKRGHTQKSSPVGKENQLVSSDEIFEDSSAQTAKSGRKPRAKRTKGSLVERAIAGDFENLDLPDRQIEAQDNHHVEANPLRTEKQDLVTVESRTPSPVVTSPTTKRARSPSPRSPSPDNHFVSVMAKIMKGNEDIFSDEATQESRKASQAVSVSLLSDESDEEIAYNRKKKKQKQKETIRLQFNQKKKKKRTFSLKKIVDYDEVIEIDSSLKGNDDEAGPIVLDEGKDEPAVAVTDVEDEIVAVFTSERTVGEREVVIDGENNGNSSHVRKSSELPKETISEVRTEAVTSERGLRKSPEHVNDVTVLPEAEDLPSPLRVPRDLREPFTPNVERQATRLPFSPLKNLGNVGNLKTPETKKLPGVVNRRSTKRILGTQHSVQNLVLPEPEDLFGPENEKFDDLMPRLNGDENFSSTRSSLRYRSPRRSPMKGAKSPSKSSPRVHGIDAYTRSPWKENLIPVEQDNVSVANLETPSRRISPKPDVVRSAHLERIHSASTIAFEPTGITKLDERKTSTQTHLSLEPTFAKANGERTLSPIETQSSVSVPSYMLDKNFYEEMQARAETPIGGQSQARKRPSVESEVNQMEKRAKIDDQMATQDSFDAAVANIPDSLLMNQTVAKDEEIDDEIRRAKEMLENLLRKKEEKLNSTRHSETAVESEDILGCSQETKITRTQNVVSSTKRLSVGRSNVEDQSTVKHDVTIQLAVVTPGPESVPATDPVWDSPATKKPGASPTLRLAGATPIPPSRKALTCTGLNTREKLLVKQFCEQFGFVDLAVYSSDVSHIVTKLDSDRRCKRTLKYLQGVAFRKWVLTVDWIKACLKAGRLLPEEPYEPDEEGDGYLTRRARKFGSNIFEGYTFCILGPLKMVSNQQLKELMVTCGANVVDDLSKLEPFGKRQAIILEPTETQQYEDIIREWTEKGVLSLSHEWITDCVGALKIIPLGYSILDFPTLGAELLKKTDWPALLVDEYGNFMETQDEIQE